MEEKAYKTMFENFKQAAKEVFLTKEEKRAMPIKKMMIIGK